MSVLACEHGWGATSNVSDAGACCPAEQVDTFQYSCLTSKDISVNKYTDFVTVLYKDSQNATANTLACPSPQFLVINSVRARRGTNKHLDQSERAPCPVLPAVMCVQLTSSWSHTCVA